MIWIAWIAAMAAVEMEPIVDVATFSRCATRAGVVQSIDWCRAKFDFDHDRDVDMDDFGALQRLEPFPGDCRFMESPGSSAITCAVWRPLPADLQAELNAALEGIAWQLSTRPAE